MEQVQPVQKLKGNVIEDFTNLQVITTTAIAAEKYKTLTTLFRGSIRLIIC